MGEFDVVIAGTSELREAAFALRHEVYCREFGFEPVRADGLESDAYDDRAQHYLLAHAPTGTWAGCVRVVPGPDLPYKAMLGDVPVDLATAPRCEISRLTVVREFRRRPDQRPSAMVHAALVALAAVAESGMADAVCVMEPWLAAQLNAVGIRLSRVSGLVHYRGDRALFHVADPVQTCRDVRSDLRPVLATIQGRVRARPLGSEGSPGWASDRHSKAPA